MTAAEGFSLAGLHPATLPIAKLPLIRSRAPHQSGRQLCNQLPFPRVLPYTRQQTNCCGRTAQPSYALAPRLNPHSLQHFPRTTRRRDFVPWRFSAAGRHGAPLDRHHRRLKTLYGAYRCQPKNHHASESFCHVTSLRCGTATPLLGCAERSSPEARVRRAEGAGLDRECADRVTIIVPRRTNDFYFVSSPFIDLIGPAAFRCKFDMIRGGARQRARKSRHSLVFG